MTTPDLTRAESNAILCYLAEGTDIWPGDRLDRASHEPYIAVLKFWTYWGGLDQLTAADQERLRTRGQAALELHHLTDAQSSD